jgi:hypothetical protein
MPRIGNIVRASAAFILVSVLVAGLCALGGALFAHFHGKMSTAHAIAYAMWIGGALAVLLTAGSGSTSTTAGGMRIVVGGRLAQGSSIPLPQTPFQYVLAGVVVVGIGILLYAYG